MLHTPFLVLALSLATLPAAADTLTGKISLGGYAQSNTGSMSTATGLAFADASGSSVSGTSGAVAFFGAGTGTFSGAGGCASFTTGCGTIYDIANFASEPATASFLTLTTDLGAITFDLTSVSSVTHTPFSLSVTALGTINLSGYDATPGELVLGSQAGGIDSFNANLYALAPNVVPTPEPSSLMLLSGSTLLLSFRRVRERILSAVR